MEIPEIMEITGIPEIEEIGVTGGGEAEEVPIIFTAETGDLKRPISCKKLAQEVDVVASGEKHWQDVCFVQFLGVDDDEAQEVIDGNPQILTLGGAGYHRSRRRKPEDEPPPTPPRGKPPPPPPSVRPVITGIPGQTP